MPTPIGLSLLHPAYSLTHYAKGRPALTISPPSMHHCWGMASSPPLGGRC